jgi:hydrogenase maturation protease
MNQTLVDQIANAVLYEGYLLYPYRPSVKNRQRWTFGGLYPQSYSQAQEGTDPWMAQTECLAQADEGGCLSVRVRFLHLQVRRIERFGPPPVGEPEAGCRSVWQEAVEREVEMGEPDLAGLAARPRAREFTFPSRREEEPLLGPHGELQGTMIREQQSIAGSLELSAERVAVGLYKLAVKIVNRTPFEPASPTSRDEAVLYSMVSTHTILGIQGGAFVSMLDPPEPWRELAAGCCNVGTWPVLVGEPGERDTILSSPIILYDYPQIAPESPGDLFDATEIDEILTLRILTLTDEEKRAMAGVDPRARALLERTESMAREQLMGLHGTIRGLRPL